MTLTLLLDLDDTLLNTNLDSFVPAYFQALAKELAPFVSPELMLRALVSGTQLMNENEDFSQTLADVFNKYFFPQIDVSRDTLKPIIENFYDNVFPSLSILTSPKPEAKAFIDWATSQGYRIAIATDPLLPRKATYHRLRWAGFNPEKFDLVSTFEDFHFSKTYASYYAELLGRMGWPDGPTLMVGNDLDRDIIPAQKLGLPTYFVVDQVTTSTDDRDITGTGKLTDLPQWIESANLNNLIPTFNSITAVMAILSATPAVINGLVPASDSSAWSHISDHDDWTLTELICHLRDTEREINQMQVRLFMEQEEPFIPRPDTGVWASTRNYLHENGASVLKEFNDARHQTLELINNFSAEHWQQKGRHAIFGPTNFLEIIGFIADHDRMHIQQAWRILKNM
jgi:FMN phosphatase YigB (HAD superfamily)